MRNIPYHRGVGLSVVGQNRFGQEVVTLGEEGEPVQVRIGDLLAGRYEVVRLIGHGAMGVVVEARNVHHGQRVAVKILKQRHKDSHEAVGRFQQEAQAASRIRGEHSVRLLDTGVHNGSPFMVMELLSGQDLASVLEEGPAPLELAAQYILQACEGIAEVHAHGMVHRDLKPSNLFLTQRPDGTPLIKLLDYGIAKGVTAPGEAALIQTQTFVAMGTPLYMSPEQIRSSREVDARTDLWSLGTIFYELLAGRPAFGGNTVTNVTAQVLEKEPAALSSIVPGLPPEIDAIVAHALKKNPDARVIDAAAFAALLEPYAGPAAAGSAARIARILRGSLRQDVITSPPVSRDDALGGTARFDPRRRVRFVRWMVGALAVTAVVLVVLAVTSYQTSRRAAGTSLAQRGLKSSLLRAADPLALAASTTVSAAPVEAVAVIDATASVSAAASPSAPTSALSTSPPSTALAAKAPASARSSPGLRSSPGPSAKATQAVAPPPVAADPAPQPPAQPTASKPYNPFSERN